MSLGTQLGDKMHIVEHELLASGTDRERFSIEYQK